MIIASLTKSFEEKSRFNYPYASHLCGVMRSCFTVIIILVDLFSVITVCIYFVWSSTAGPTIDSVGVCTCVIAVSDFLLLGIDRIYGVIINRYDFVCLLLQQCED
ncbi:hypothetical protein D918_07487 [Trichuris suis]|nr:hypothetical protein D918_07487 [Trichuris suis]